jgi:hypothetical protein
LLQHLLPLPTSPPAAIAAGYRRLFKMPEIEEIRFSDWAFLSDITVGDEETARAGVEFGIVTPEEIPRRLARQAGRVGASVGGQGFVPNLDQETFAEASLFADSWWYGSPAEQMPFIQAALQFWYTSRERADRVVEAIHVALCREDEQRGRRSA